MNTPINNAASATSPVANKAQEQKRSLPAKPCKKLAQCKQKSEKQHHQAPIERIKAVWRKTAVAFSRNSKPKTKEAESTNSIEIAQPVEIATIKPYDPRTTCPTVSDTKRRAQLKAIKCIASALIAEAMILEARGVQYTQTTQIVVEVTKATASNKYCTTGKVAGIDTSNKSRRKAYAAAAMALENAGLALCTWPPNNSPRIPIEIKTNAADITKIATFCRLPVPKQNFMLHTSEKHEMPQNKPDSPISSNNTKAEALANFAKTCPNEKLAHWARKMLNNKKSTDTSLQTPQTKINVPPEVLLPSLKFLTQYPFPICPPVEKKVLSAEVLGNSKALDGKVEKFIAHVLYTSKAVQYERKKSTVMTLKNWGILESNPVLFLGGDIVFSTEESTLDLATLKEHFCVESGFFEQPLRVNARQVRSIVIVENKAAFRQCVRCFGKNALFAYIDGTWNTHAAAALESVHHLLEKALNREEGRLQTYLWFDMDGGGISRARQLLERFPGSQCVLMSARDYDALYANHGYVLTGGQLRQAYKELAASRPSDEGLKALAERIAEHGRGIEQEALLTGYAQKYFAELFAKDTTAKKVPGRVNASNKNLNPKICNRAKKTHDENIAAVALTSGLGTAAAITLGAAIATNYLKK